LRLWSLHPGYLDSKGLVAVWREGLLAKKVLENGTIGYRHHPQLERFKIQAAPLTAIHVYLEAVLAEARKRGYNFDERKIEQGLTCPPIFVTRGQLEFEMGLLRKKLEVRDPQHLQKIGEIKEITPHPQFKLVEGEVEFWEKGHF
jgi:hypothetical protein